MQENERRSWMRTLAKFERIVRGEERRPWGEVIKKATEEQLMRRELNSDLDVIEYQARRIHFSESEIYYMDHEGSFWDEVSGNRLNSEEVVAARLDEIKQLHSHHVYDKVPLTECWESTGRNPVKVKWIDINKGDNVNHEYRSRLVAKEIKMDKRLDLFAATPPLEAKKLFFSAAVTEGIGYDAGYQQSGMKIDFIDISRAFFQADAIREVYVELPAEDAADGMCAKLKKSMYGTRDAAQNWGYAYTQFMCDTGFVRGQSSPCVFWNPERVLRCVVHGDDFTVLGHKEDLNWFWTEISKKFESKHRGRIGPEESDLKEIRILNRIVTWTTSGIQYEADQRHVEICLQEVGLEDSSKPISTPIDRSAKDSKNRNSVVNSEADAELLNPSAATKYRGIVARMNYLGQDRCEIQFAVKELGKEMSTPTQGSWTKMKRLLRYLMGVPRAVLHFDYQRMPDAIVTWTDSDFAGCEKSRKSTSAGVVQIGTHLIKSWSTNQAVIALSSGESEYYALVKAGSQSLGVKALAIDMGIEFVRPIELNSDASAAIGIGNRIGSGKVRHIEVTQLWLQDKVSQKIFVLNKVGTDDNLADALTKGVDAHAIQRHLEGVRVELRCDRHQLAPVIDAQRGAEMKLDDE